MGQDFLFFPENFRIVGELFVTLILFVQNKPQITTKRLLSFITHIGSTYQTYKYTQHKYWKTT